MIELILQRRRNKLPRLVYIWRRNCRGRRSITRSCHDNSFSADPDLTRVFHHFLLVVRDRDSSRSKNQKLRNKLTLSNTGKSFSVCSREQLQASNEVSSKRLSCFRQVLSFAENSFSKLSFLWRRCKDIPSLILKLLVARLRQDKYDEMKRGLSRPCMLMSSNFQQGWEKQLAGVMPCLRLASSEHRWKKCKVPNKLLMRCFFVAEKWDQIVSFCRDQTLVELIVACAK